MRHSRVEKPRRLRPARAVLRARSRALPFALAIPLVALAWLTIGLPVLANLTSASGSGNRRARNTVFVATAATARSRPQVEAAVTFSPAVLHEVGNRVRWLRAPNPSPAPNHASQQLRATQPRSLARPLRGRRVVSKPSPVTPPQPPAPEPVTLAGRARSEEHTSELQSPVHLVC